MDALDASELAGSREQLPRWQRWLLPATLGAEPATLGAEDLAGGRDGGSRLPRSARDWVVDIVLFGFAVVVGLGGMVPDHHDVGTTMLVFDGALGIPACLALWVRRSHTLAVGWLALGLSAVSDAAYGAAIVASFTVAVHCMPRRTLQALAGAIVGAAIRAELYRSHGYNLGHLTFWIALAIAAVGIGSFVRVRRQLFLSLQERARRLEGEQRLRVRQAQLAERARIAREMHDVLAHRISLLSVHAGALEFNPDASAKEIARAAGVIRVSARAAQEELREVIGVLRAEIDPEAAQEMQPPQPTIADLAALVDESRAAGMNATLRSRLTNDDSLPPLAGRTVYRLVQEGLTNARKHAPGQVVSIGIDGDPSGGVRVEVVNRPAVGQARAGHQQHVGAGTGLIGLTERMSIVGGTLDWKGLADGGFRLAGWLPWGAGT